MAFAIAPNQIGIHFGHFLRDKTKGNRLRAIVLFVVTETHRPERVEHFAGFVHWLNVVFVSAG